MGKMGRPAKGLAAFRKQEAVFFRVQLLPEVLEIVGLPSQNGRVIAGNEKLPDRDGFHDCERL
jgi:hypothetical protein